MKEKKYIPDDVGVLVVDQSFQDDCKEQVKSV